MVYTIPTALLALLAAATALPTTPLIQRAGAPAIVPITPPCTLSYPLSEVSTTPSQSYRVIDDIVLANQTYTWDLSQDDSAYYNRTTLWTQCIEQCNGYDGCKAAFFAYNVPSEPRYGQPGGSPSMACRFFSVDLAAESFETVTNGSYTGAVAANIDNCGK